MTMTDKTRLIVYKLQLTPTLARFLEILLAHKAVTYDMLLDKGVGTDEQCIRAHASRLRKHLAKREIEIINSRSGGYWLTPDGKDAIRNQLE